MTNLACRGILKKYVKVEQHEVKKTHQSTHSDTSDDPHETPILGEFNTITEGFSGGGASKSARKRYARSVMMTSVSMGTSPTPSLTFTEKDFQYVAPHEDDPVVLSVIMVGRKV